MLNNRTKNRISDMKWNSTYEDFYCQKFDIEFLLFFFSGQMICIGHEDGNKIDRNYLNNYFFLVGNVIIGSVEGSRIAGKSLRNNKLAKVEVRDICCRDGFS